MKKILLTFLVLMSLGLTSHTRAASLVATCIERVVVTALNGMTETNPLSSLLITFTYKQTTSKYAVKWDYTFQDGQTMSFSDSHPTLTPYQISSQNYTLMKLAQLPSTYNKITYKLTGTAAFGTVARQVIYYKPSNPSTQVNATLSTSALNIDAETVQNLRIDRMVAP